MIRKLLEILGWRLEKMASPTQQIVTDDEREAFNVSAPRIHHGIWGSHYVDGDVMRIAIGQDGWVPVAALVSTFCEDGGELRLRKMRQRLGHELAKA